MKTNQNKIMTINTVIENNILGKDVNGYFLYYTG